MTTFWVLARTAVALACVLGLIWWGARRWAPRRAAGDAHVRVVDRTSLGRHTGVAVIEVGDRHVLVGFGEQGVGLLAELPNPGCEPAVVPVRTPEVLRATGTEAAVPRRTGPAAAQPLPGRPVAAPRRPSEIRAVVRPLPAASARPVVLMEQVRPVEPSGAAKRAALLKLVERFGAPEPDVETGPPAGTQPTGPLAGSVLSPTTWRDTVRALQEKTVRR